MEQYVVDTEGRYDTARPPEAGEQKSNRQTRIPRAPVPLIGCNHAGHSSACTPLAPCRSCGAPTASPKPPHVCKLERT
jgi:hypothetical protein